MHMLALLLPMICFVILLNRNNLRESFLISAVAYGLFVALSTEVLSLLKCLDYLHLVACWSLYLLALVTCRYCRKGGAWTVTPPATTPFQKLLLALLAGIVCITGITAVVAAPNNFDSLTYHLPRIMHWIQNRSVQHYPTHIDRQLVLAPFSEFAMMHLQLLSGGDRFDNCVQWFSLLGSAVGVSLIARALGGSPNSLIVAAALSVSVPMGLLQSTSTQNDYAVTFWLVCLTYYAIRGDRSGEPRHVIAVALALALAIFTKGTAYLVALPFMLVYLGRLGLRSAKAAAGAVLVIAVAILLVNGGHYARNYRVYQDPISPGTGNGVIGTGLGVPSVVSGVAKNVATQLATGFSGANDALGALTERVHGALGVQINDPGLTLDRPFSLPPARTHEDYASNPVHMLLLLCSALTLVLGRKRYSRETVLFAATAMLSFVVLSVGIKWNPFISRYFLPVLVISAPFLSLLYDGIRLRPVVNSCAALLLVWSFFILAHNEMRPLVGSRSIFVTQRIDQYFMTRPQAKPYFLATANMIKGQPVSNVGILNTDSNMWEYILWVLLKEDGGNYRIEHVDVENGSGGIKLDGFTYYFPVQI